MEKRIARQTEEGTSYHVFNFGRWLVEQQELDSEEYYFQWGMLLALFGRTGKELRDTLEQASRKYGKEAAKLADEMRDLEKRIESLGDGDMELQAVLNKLNCNITIGDSYGT